jgi:hypothetical protein
MTTKYQGNGRSRQGSAIGVSGQRSAASYQQGARWLALLSGLHLLDTDADSLLAAKRFGSVDMAITLKAVGDQRSAQSDRIS